MTISKLYQYLPFFVSQGEQIYFLPSADPPQPRRSGGRSARSCEWSPFTRERGPSPPRPSVPSGENNIRSDVF